MSFYTANNLKWSKIISMTSIYLKETIKLDQTQTTATQQDGHSSSISAAIFLKVICLWPDVKRTFWSVVKEELFPMFDVHHKFGSPIGDLRIRASFWESLCPLQLNGFNFDFGRCSPMTGMERILLLVWLEQVQWCIRSVFSTSNKYMVIWVF